jgi:hypothetical protein
MIDTVPATGARNAVRARAAGCREAFAVPDALPRVRYVELSPVAVVPEILVWAAWEVRHVGRGDQEVRQSPSVIILPVLQAMNAEISIHLAELAPGHHPMIDQRRSEGHRMSPASAPLRDRSERRDAGWRAWRTYADLIAAPIAHRPLET